MWGAIDGHWFLILNIQTQRLWHRQIEESDWEPKSGVFSGVFLHPDDKNKSLITVDAMMEGHRKYRKAPPPPFLPTTCKTAGP